MKEYRDNTPEFEDYKQRVKDWNKKMLLRQIPDDTLPEFHSYVHIPFEYMGLQSGYLRQIYIEKVGYPLIVNKWVKPLATWIGDRKCLEVMAGSGSLTYALRKHGVSIHATDDFSWGQPFRPWLQVENIDCLAAVEKYGKVVDFIICSWPYMDDTAYNLLMKMREVNPKCRMIYLGESYGGCTANDRFFDAVEEVDLKGFLEVARKYKSWDMIHDSLWLYK